MGVSDKINLLKHRIMVIASRGDMDKRRGALRKLNRQLRALASALN